MLAEPCLLCGKEGPSEAAHWPLSRRYGIATVPLCRECHSAAHWAKQWAVEALIRLAPGYWRHEGTWELHREAYENWCSKRRYLEAVR